MTRRPGFRAAVLAALALLFATAVSTQRPVRGQGALEVDLILVLAIDCSWSIDDAEYDLQMQATAAAFRRPEIVAAIRNGPLGRAVVALAQWSDRTSQAVAVPWMLIDGMDSAFAAARRIENAPRLIHRGPTSIGSAIQFSTALIGTSPYAARRRVIDVSSDGRNNNGDRPEASRDIANALGIAVNGLTILSPEFPVLDYYFRRAVVGGPGHFVEIANDHSAYPQAIYRKLLKELRPPIS